MKERWKKFWALFSLDDGWSRGRKALTYLVILVFAAVLLVCVCRPCPTLTPAPTPTPTPTLPTKAEVEEQLPEMWFRGISWELMLSRIEERFPGTEPRPEFWQGAKYMVMTVKEGDYFVAPDHELLPWPPA